MDKISERLGAMTPIERTEREVKSITSDVNSIKDNLDADYKEARNNIKELIDSSMSLIPDLINVVRESEKPQMYESASNFIKMVAELNTTLIEVTKKSLSEDSKKAGKTATQEITNNAVFIGTGDEVFRQLSRRKDILEG